MNTVQTRMNELLKDLGENSNSFGKKYDFAQQSVSNWATGKVRPPERTLRLISQKTGCSAEWLIDGTGEMWPNGVKPIVAETPTSPNVLEEVLKELRELRKVISTMAQANSELTAMLSRGSKLLGNRVVPMAPTVMGQVA